MAKIFTYAINEFPNKQVNISNLYETIVKSQIRAALDGVEVVNNNCVITFKIDLLPADIVGGFNYSDQSVLNSIVANHSGKPNSFSKVELADPKDNNGVVKVATVPFRDGVPFNIASHNFCNKTSWFYGAELNQNVSLVRDINNPRLFKSNIPFWIDLTSGNVLREEVYAQYWNKPLITVNDVIYNVETIDEEGECIIDYAAGTVLFKEDVSSVVKASFYSAKSSLFFIRPPVGKKLRIEHSDIQFTNDVSYNDTLIIEFWSNFGTPNQSLIDNTSLQYPSARVLVDEMEGSYPVIPAINGIDGRGIKETIVLRARIGQSTIFDSATNDCIVVRLKNDVAFGGQHATVTFYCSEID